MSSTDFKQTKYTRISINSKLDNALKQVQTTLPLYSTNDTINFLISKGYREWLKENSIEQEHNEWLENLHTSPSFDFLNDPKEDIYSLNDGKKVNDKN